ncbi:MAG: PASTA domain-containing protein [Gemmatimonadaceae bacterium]|jgi:serine/threonine-protein kinase|nr:PASTA domain-containing protein [Gemmatimonadaceae bacterium]
MARSPRFARLRGAFAQHPFIATALTAFAAGFVVVALWLLPDTFRTVEAKVPNVVGLLYDDAKARLQQAGFDAAEGETLTHPTAPRGSVLGQLPEPGALEARGATITLDVSLGPKRGTVPDLVGMSRAEAERALQSAGFDLGAVTERIDQRPRGEIVASTPAVGTSVLQPASVAIVVSAGPDALSMPDLIGMPAEEALSIIGQVGLVAGSAQADSSSTQPEGSVARQSPRAGALVPPGTTVTLTISRPRPAGIEPVEPPPGGEPPP